MIREVSLEEIHDIWNDLASKHNGIMPFFSFEWYESWIAVQKEWRPYILLIDNETIAPFVRNGHIVEFIHQFTDYSDLVGKIDSNVWSSLLNFIKTDQVRHLKLENIPERSATVNFFGAKAKATKTTPTISLPTTFEDYLSTIKTKRRKYRKFKNDFPGAVVIRSDEPEKDIDRFLDLHKADPKKHATLTKKKREFFIRIASSIGTYVWLNLLTINNQTVAWLYMFKAEKTIFVYNSGHLKESYPNGGTYLMIESIRQTVENGYNEFNLLSGKEEYKYEMGAVDKFTYSIEEDI